MPLPNDAQTEPHKLLVATLISDLDGDRGPDENARAFLVALEIAGYAIRPVAEAARTRDLTRLLRDYVETFAAAEAGEETPTETESRALLLETAR